MSTTLEKVLEDLKLQPMEAKVYLATLELGEATAAEIAKKSKLKRPTVYVVLKQLTTQGIVSSYQRRKVTRFGALNPEQLVARYDERLQQAKDALPELAALYNTKSSTKPKVQFFEGKEGLIEIMEDTIVVPHKTILGWGDVQLAHKTLADYYPTYVKKKNEQNVFVQGIYLDNKMGRRYRDTGSTEHRKLRLLPPDVFPMSNEINIYEDKVMIISHKDLTGVIIQNAEIAETQRAIFKLGWLAAERYEQ